ncbi:hypothetical protein HBHAL_3107 [Halobacillus halophilus DSM 2266]|uniref:Uncharacterized protein n=1 Tax=Halobacillus halophilus (strain ATCC 35676 / DSM 2266 / JCM 20832 / KCTC 3685 / LMG 17431 / NBRC 102448 / NCIMB 2269) TaxID=866895 RepID=I0JMT4_HALH3|nr:hypothetical protein HBHAL_3107 [Halobacillus halophilus DSM 2266]
MKLFEKAVLKVDHRGDDHLQSLKGQPFILVDFRSVTK